MARPYRLWKRRQISLRRIKICAFSATINLVHDAFDSLLSWGVCILVFYMLCVLFRNVVVLSDDKCFRGVVVLVLYVPNEGPSVAEPNEKVFEFLLRSLSHCLAILPKSWMYPTSEASIRYITPSSVLPHQKMFLMGYQQRHNFQRQSAVLYCEPSFSGVLWIYTASISFTNPHPVE